MMRITLLRGRGLARRCIFFAVLAACGPSSRGEPWQLSAASAIADPDDYHDSLSAPLTPTLDASNFLGPEACGACHASHVAEWRGSLHAHAMHDPVFRGLVALQREDRGKSDADAFCVQCHSPIALRAGQIAPGFDFEALTPLALAGVSCEVCHRAEKVERPFNAGLSIARDGVLRGPIEDPQAPHATQFDPLLSDASLCASCHDVRSVGGVVLESPYVEWLSSPAAAAGVTCQSCHMARYAGRTAPGYSAQERPALHRHTFSAVEPVENTTAACSDPGKLCAAARLSAAFTAADSDGWQLAVGVENLIAGHNFPTGSTFFRQVWLAVQVQDEYGHVLFQSGALDEAQDLADCHAADGDRERDPQLHVLHDCLLGDDGRPTLFPWRAVSLERHSLEPGKTVTFAYRGTRSGRAGVLRADVRLRFRKFPPRLVRELADIEADELEIYDVRHVTVLSAGERSADNAYR